MGSHDSHVFVAGATLFALGVYFQYGAAAVLVAIGASMMLLAAIADINLRLVGL